MAILKVIEILADSPKSWEDATANAVKEASKTIRNIKGVNIDNMSAQVNDDGSIRTYRVNCKITFLKA